MSNTHTDILLAGAFAAFTVDLLVYPLDTLKTRLQSPDYKKIYYNASKTAVNKKLLLGGLYQGVGSVILITLPSSGAFFTSYEAVKSVLTKANHATGSSPMVPQPIVHSIASATAELVSCFILTPAEVLKQNAQMIRQPESNSSSSRPTSVSLQALKEFQHPRQLWTGYTALAARNLPFTAMQFPLYEYLKDAGKNYRKNQGTYSGSLLENGVITGLSAGSAGSLAAWITTPVDLVKTRVMLAAAGESSAAEAKKVDERAKAEGKSMDEIAKQKGTRKGAIQVAREVLRESGIKGLFRGAALRSGWTAIGSGLYLGTYESGRVYLERRHEKIQR